jgi:hypothetical protein
VGEYTEKAGMSELVVSSHGPHYDLEPLRRLVAIRDSLTG